MPPRVALLGFTLESNRLAPAATGAVFAENYLLRGEEIVREARGEAPRGGAFMPGFVRRMDELGPWEPIPLVHTSGSGSGVIDPEFWAAFRSEVAQGLERAGPLDGVYIAGHGAGVGDPDLDLDGELFALVRATVGEAIPLVATLDLHGFVSAAMVESADVLVAHRTYPHVDGMERGAEAAEHLVRAIRGEIAPKAAWRRLPWLVPTASQWTAADQPYGRIIAYGQDAARRLSLLNVSILAGFQLADTHRAGFAIVATADGDPGVAEAAVDDIARFALGERDRFVVHALSVGDAVAAASQAPARSDGPALCLVDINDNPGGGANGNSTGLLQALLDAGVEGALVGAFADPGLAAQALFAGQGATINAVLNAGSRASEAPELRRRARVLSASPDTRYRPSRGMFAGTLVECGATCALDLGGVRLAVISHRKQIMDDGLFEALGVEARSARVLVLKSTVMFRAGFDHLVPPERTWLVDADGLGRFDFTRLSRRLPRPIWPHDGDRGASSASAVA